MYESSTVYVSEVDREKLLELAEEIGEILAKYPYSNDTNSNFYTEMARAKNKFAELKKSITLLEVKE